MKFRFNEQELEYLHDRINWVLVTAPREAEPVAIRTFAKMRWKFGPGAHTVTLGLKERAALTGLLEYRARALEGNTESPIETAVVSELLKKVAV
jgi:hypothetical protein